MKTILSRVGWIAIGLIIGFFLFSDILSQSKVISNTPVSDTIFAAVKKPNDYLYLKSTIRLMEKEDQLSKQDMLFVLNSLVLEIERLEKEKQEKP
jgi:hypothetical protein